MGSATSSKNTDEQHKMKGQLVLVLASRHTTDACRDVFEKEFDAEVASTRTVSETIEKLRKTKKPIACVVAALGTKKENRLFDDKSSDASTLIDAARALKIRLIVYTHTACKAENRWMALACEDAGADAVVCSRDSLRDCVTSILACETMKRMKSDENDEKEHLRARAPSPTNDKTWVESYPPLRRRRARDEFLQRKLGRTHKVVYFSKRTTDQFKKYLVRLKRPLLAPPTARRVRFVHVSDTHNCHNHLRFHGGTGGDVLLHTGDCVGNYRHENVHEHFKSFVKWLIEMSKVFKHVVFIAGNHDIQLDYSRSEETLSMLKECLPDNVHYLNNTSVKIMGVRIFGSSFCVSRAEEKNKRYMSNAFERDRVTRKAMYEKCLVDGEIDVLLTHAPPSGILCWNEKRNFMGPGDPILRFRLDELKSPPRFHCFGHDHDYFGVKQDNNTTFLNAANQQFLCNESEWDEVFRSGGCPLIFDVMLERIEKRGRIGSRD